MKRATIEHPSRPILVHVPETSLVYLDTLASEAQLSRSEIIRQLLTPPIKEYTVMTEGIQRNMNIIDWPYTPKPIKDYIQLHFMDDMDMGQNSFCGLCLEDPEGEKSAESFKIFKDWCDKHGLTEENTIICIWW